MRRPVNSRAPKGCINCPHCGKLVGDQPERSVSVREAATILGLAEKTVYKLVSRRLLGSEKKGTAQSGKVTIPLSALDAYRANLQSRPAL